MTTKLIPQEMIQNRILFSRGTKVMLDSDLARLYGVPTFRLNEAVKRNRTRFPKDFMFQLTKKECQILVSQIAIPRWGGRRTPPFVFTEHGILMLSSVLNSERAVQVNIQIMRTFTQLREMLANHKKLRQKIEDLEKKYDGQFQIVFRAIKKLLESPTPPPPKPKGPIGFHA